MYFSYFLYFVHVRAITIRVQKDLDVFCSNESDAVFPFFQICSMKNRTETASNIVCSNCSTI